ncbi:MAG: hypothetical protein M1818_001446 [Claussenomyces sp. TS43310]|nr:MAG: hypothetical protein M1818_001446 [Claussenomyces sp. TS43310]
MSPQLPPWYRAVHQNSLTFNSVWITDDILLGAMRHFHRALRVSRRKASSVPGPMECRRRTGKRKMTHISAATPTSMQDFCALWSFGGVVDRTQWQWEAPTISPLVDYGSPPRLQPWLREDEPLAGLARERLEATTIVETCASRSGAESGYLLRQDLEDFRAKLRRGPIEALQVICDTFNRDIKQRITLGLVQEDILSLCLSNVTEDIRKAFRDVDLVTSLSLDFYRAVWEGMKACRIMAPSDMGSLLLNRLLLSLSKLPQIQAVQVVASEILKMSSACQLLEMEQGITAIVKTWVCGWTSEDLCPAKSKKTTIIYSYLEDRALMCSSRALRTYLGHLPPDLATMIIRSSAAQIMDCCLAESRGSTRATRGMRYWWIRAVAGVHCMTEDLLIEISSTMDISSRTGTIPDLPPLTLFECCQALLDFWASHGQLSRRNRIKREFEHKARNQEKPLNAGLSLLVILDRYKQLCWTKAQSLFTLLRRIGRPHMVYGILQTLVESRVKMPASLIAREINLHNPQTALRIYRLYRKVRHCNTPLLLDGCPELIIKMINDCDLHPSAIWGTLGVPIYHPGRIQASDRSLPRARVALIHRMALAFATSEARSNRVAFRNVMQCIMYLRRHRVPLSVDLTRALCYVGITREMVRNQWVGTEKLVWILDLIQRVEGEEVSGEIDRALYQCRQRFVAGRHRAPTGVQSFRIRPN